MSDLNKLKELANTVDFWGSTSGWQPDELHETIHFALKQAERQEVVEAELARRDAAAGEAIHFYREHNPTNGMKTDWIEVDSIQFGFLQDSTDPDTAEFRTLYTAAAAQPLALPFDIEPLLERALKLHGLRTADVGHSQLSDGFRNGARWAAKALGCKAIKFGPSLNPEMFNSDVMFGYLKARKECAEMIRQQGFTVEGE